MNTPDYTPKNGDFVAYLEELERLQLRAHATAPMGNATKGAPTAARPLSTPMAPVPVPGSVQPPAGIAPIANPLDLARNVPVGLVLVGIVLVIAGLAFNNGFILVIIGLLMLASAIRQAIKGAIASVRSTGATPAQQVAAILNAATQQKGSAKK